MISIKNRAIFVFNYHNSGKWLSHLLEEASHLNPLSHIIRFNQSHVIQHIPHNISSGHQRNEINAIGKNITDKSFIILFNI